METLELPRDIIWDGDSPTLSPSHLSNASAEEIPIFEDSFATELIPNDDLIKPSQNQVIEFSPEEFEQLLDMHQELENIIVEEPVDDQWLDQPINIPLDEYAPVQDARIYPVKGNTAQLLNEFNQVYDAVELTHLTPPETPPVTPPHSPPQAPLQAYLNDSKNQFYTQAIQNYPVQCQPQQQFLQYKEKPVVNYSTPIFAKQFPSILEQAISLVQQTNSTEYVESIDDAMAEVEELVRSRAEDLVDSSYDDDNSSFCGSSSCFSPRSESSSTITDDSDWTPKQSSSIGAVGAALKVKQSKQKRKPRVNRRSLEDRQSRKKEQNKSAANRYRLKKKAEIEILLDEERELKTRNEQLQHQYQEVGREVKYIKNLLRELFKAKGLIN